MPSLEDLAAVDRLLLITSTYGEGEPPDNAQAFHTALHADSAPRLEHLQFSVLGLGDSSYPDFCQCSKEFDARFEALGAQRSAAMVECDGDPRRLRRLDASSHGKFDRCRGTDGQRFRGQ